MIIKKEAKHYENVTNESVIKKSVIKKNVTNENVIVSVKSLIHWAFINNTIKNEWIQIQFVNTCL